MRYHGKGADTSLQIGRFEYFDGQETTPKSSTLLWLQTNRISQRLVGNFGFPTVSVADDGVDGHYGKGTWDIAAMAGRATQGVFNMNANPELNVGIQYMAYTKRQFKDHMLFRVFGLGWISTTHTPSPGRPSLADFPPGRLPTTVISNSLTGWGVKQNTALSK